MKNCLAPVICGPSIINHGSFTAVTLTAKSAQICGIVGSATRLGDDVINGVRRCGMTDLTDILWLNGHDLRDLPLVERKEMLRKVIPRKSSWVGCISYVDRGALNLFELVKKGDLEGLVVKRKDGKYTQQTVWYKILNPTYTQKAGRQEFFQRQ